MSKRSNAFVRACLRVFVFVLGLGLGLFAFVYYLLTAVVIQEVGLVNESGRLLYSATEGPLYMDSENPLQQRPKKFKKQRTVLIFGLDGGTLEERNERGRSDSMLLLTVDSQSKHLKLASLMRDSRVRYMGSNEQGKLNAAYTIGGVGLLMNTINEQFDLDVQHYMAFDFSRVAKLIDAIDGLELSLSDEEVVATNAVIKEFCQMEKLSPDVHLLRTSGTQNLSGLQASAFARVRAVGNDQGRTSRQRLILMEILNKIRRAPLDRKLYYLSKTRTYFVTNLSKMQMMRLFWDLYRYSEHLDERQVPAEGHYETGAETAWDLVIDYEKEVPALHSFMTGGAER